MQYIKFTHHRTSYKLPFRQVDLSLIDSNKLRNVLEDGLKRTFVDVSVKWVKCPDLTQEPFNLAAPGLCGQTAFMEIGDLSYLEPKPRKDKFYHINNILNFLNRDCSNSFIFGAGIFAHPNWTLGELVINTSCWPASDGTRIISDNRVISVDTSENKCNVDMSPTIDLKCRIHGNFFLCEGSVGPVLEVRAKRYHSTVEPDSGFINAMQDIIQETFGPDEFVGLGGVYVPSGIFWTHQLKQHSWEPQMSPSKRCCNVCKVNVPEAIITTFSNNTTGLLQYSPEFPPIKLTSKSTHCLSHHNAGEHFFYESTTDGMEYLGYFCPAQKVYRIDEPLTKFPNLQ